MREKHVNGTMCIPVPVKLKQNKTRQCIHAQGLRNDVMRRISGAINAC